MSVTRGQETVHYRAGANDMLLELWIILTVIIVGAIGVLVVRLRRKREREAAAQSGTESKVYPLW
jgi:hypothetical protein